MTTPAPGLSPSPDAKRLLSPLDALRRVRAILQDPGLSAAEKVAATAIVIHCNGQSGISRPGITFLRQAYKLGSDSIRKAIEHCLQAGHFQDAVRGAHGARRLRIMPGPKPDSSTASLLPTGNLATDQFTCPPAPDYPPEAASLPVERSQVTPGGSGTSVWTCEEPAGGTGALSPGARDGPAKNGDGNGQDAEAEEVLRAAFPGGATEAQRAAVLNAVTEARRRGATTANMLAALEDPDLSPKPWLRIEQAARRAKTLPVTNVEETKRIAGFNRIAAFKRIPAGSLARRADGLAGRVHDGSSDRALVIDVRPSPEAFIQITDARDLSKWIFSPAAAVPAEPAAAGAAP